MWYFRTHLRYCIIGAVALFSLTSAQLKPNAIVAPAQSAHAPMIRVYDPNGQPVFGPRGQSVSGNWSGYDLSTGSTGNYTSASFHWRVQSAQYVNYGGANPYSFNDSSQWVGIGGFSTNDLIQLGSESFVSSGGVPTYYVWYEMLPANETVLPAQYTASAGDAMTASLACTANCTVNNSNSQWSLSMSDTTKGWTWTGTFTYASCLCSAEWIDEAPDYGQIVGISNFGTGSFTNLTVNGGNPGLSLNPDGIILQDGDGGFATPCQAFNGAQLGNGNQFLVSYGQTCPSTFDSHDFNDDAVSDVLWRNTTGSLAMWLMSGGRESSGATIAQVSGAWSVVGSRDFNGDGYPDILWLDGSGDLGLWEMNGASVSSQIGLGNVGTSWKVVGTGDFNGDGRGDILWRDSSGDLAIWLMSNGQFASGVSLGQVGIAWSVAGTGDFNGDGTTDILWYNTQTGDVAVWLISNGQFSSGIGIGNVGTSWKVVGTGDFNGDGTSDILWGDTSGDYAIWLMSNGQFSSGATIASGVAATWSVAETGDFNGDGKSDILWTDGSGDVGVWLMNGTSVSSTIGLGNVGTSWQVQAKNAD